MNTEARMMTASAVTKREGSLKHYGVLGMKWGIRRYQPYGMGGYNPKDTGKYIGKRKLQRELNKTDKQRAQFQDSVTIARNKQAKYQIGGDDTAANKWKKAGDDYEARLNEAKARTKNLLRQADERGFDVHSKEVQRHVRSGQHFLEWFAAGIPGVVAGNIAENVINGKSGVEVGTKYKVTKGTPKPKGEWKDDGDAEVTQKFNEQLASGKVPTKADYDKIVEDVKLSGNSFIKGKTDGGEDYSLGDFETKSYKYGGLEGTYDEAKMKIGKDREIKVFRDTDSDYNKNYVNEVVKNLNSIESEIKEKVAKEFYDENPDWYSGMTRNEFKKKIKLQSISADTEELHFYDDSKDDVLFGHSYDVEYDTNKKRIYGTSFNG